MKQSWRYGSATAVPELQHGICLLDLRGPISASVISAVRTDLQAMRAGPIHVYIVDYSKAVLAMPAQTLEEITLEARAAGVITTPVAYVCNREELKVFQQHAFNMIQHGLTRVAFLSLDRALDWAVQKAAVALVRERDERSLASSQPQDWRSAAVEPGGSRRTLGRGP